MLFLIPSRKLKHSDVIHLKNIFKLLWGNQRYEAFVNHVIRELENLPINCKGLVNFTF